MTRPGFGRRLALSLSAAAVALGLAGRMAPAQDPPASPPTVSDKVKQKVSGAVQSLKKGAATAEEAVREQYARARAAVSRMGVEARVYSRIHWEKNLTGARIDLAAPSEGVIALNGTVPDERARAKAVELARDTVGVTQVIDNLTVQTTTRGAAGGAKP